MKRYEPEDRWFQLVISVPTTDRNLKAALKTLAQKNNMSMSKQVVEILRKHLVRQELL